MLVDRSVDVLIVPARALFQRLPIAEKFRGRVITLTEGEELDLHSLLQKLVENGFVRTDLVGEAGEFAFRGGILDLFPATTPKPVRVELFGDTIDSLRWFDVETQRSEEPSGPVTILPMTQFAIDKEMRTALARRLSLDFNDPLYKRDLAEKIDRLQENGTFPGIEHYLPVAGTVGHVRRLHQRRRLEPGARRARSDHHDDREVRSAAAHGVRGGGREGTRRLSARRSSSCPAPTC